jgi:hypothetical protein
MPGEGRRIHFIDLVKDTQATLGGRTTGDNKIGKNSGTGKLARTVKDEMKSRMP